MRYLKMTTRKERATSAVGILLENRLAPFLDQQELDVESAPHPSHPPPGFRRLNEGSRTSVGGIVGDGVKSTLQKMKSSSKNVLGGWR